MHNNSPLLRRRVRVPASLHAELTEHAILIKTIRTNHILDLTHQLYLHANRQRSASLDCENDCQGKGKSKSRDIWTTWPLIDCTTPEWRLEDEIKSLAEIIARQLRMNRPNDSQSSDTEVGETDDEDEELEPFSSSLLHALVWQVTKVLVCILDTILEHRPAVANSMQNRMWAFDWEGVLKILISGMTLDETVISAAYKRLSSIYGSSKGLDIAVSRIGRVKSRTSDLTICSESHDDTFLRQPTVRIRKPPNKRRRILSKKTIETDTE